MRAGKYRKPDDVHIFLKGGFYDHFWRLPQPGIDDFHARITQGACDDFCTAIMPIQTRFGDQNTYAQLVDSS
jgi:hypothetical protein